MTITSQSVERPLTALDVIFTRRSVRAYTGRCIDQQTVAALLDAAVQAPTALYAEPWAFVVIQDAAALGRYSDLAKAKWASELGGERELHATGEAALRSRFTEEILKPDLNIFYDAGTLIVICAKPTGPYAVADCWLAAENLMLAACAMGLGTCCIGSATVALNTPEVKKELDIPAAVTVVAPIIVGVPRGGTAAVSRKNPEILSWRR